MEKQKESFLIIFEDNQKFNMVMHIKKEKVDNRVLLYLEPCLRVKSTNTYLQGQITDCGCDNCKKRLHFLMENSKEIGVFNGIGDNIFQSDNWRERTLDTTSFVCVRLDTLIGIKEQLEKITGEKIKHIGSIEKEKLLDPNPYLLGSFYANPNFEDLLKNFLPLSFFKLT